MLGNTLVNQLMPLPQQPESRQLPEPSPTYSLRGQSNIARIGQPITLHYGRHIVWPDLIMSPYYEYDGEDQWYHTLMCVGLGHIEVTDIKFGDVALLSLDSGDYGVQVIYPGQGVTLLPATVYTAAVSGAELSSAWSASGYSNPPGSTVGEIGVDVAFNGLVKISRNGDMQDHTVTVEVQARPVNDVNAPLGGWTTVITEAITDNTVDAVRRTIKASVAGGRYEVQARVTVDPINGQDNDKNTFRDVCVWGGLRGYGGTHPAYGDCTLLAVKVKANELLSQQSTQQISCLGHRHLKHWTTAGGWSGLQASRSIVWAMVDAYLNANNGNQPENTLLLTELETLHTRLETLNNHFDYRFDETGAKLLPTMNMIARAGRSSVIHHIGRWRLIRDEPKTVPVQMFTADNMTGFNVSLSAPQDYDPDALIGTFIDADTWQQATLTYSDVSEPIRAETIDLPGITSRQHAWAELAYMVKAEKRRERGSFTTGMEGRIPVPHDLIAVCPEGVDWGHWGHIVAKTDSTLSLSNALPFTSGKIMLRNSVGGSLGVFDIAVTNDTEATATGLPAFDLPDIHREPIYYIAGETESSIILCKVTDLTPQQNDQVQISFVVEDSGVYLAPGAVPEDEVSVIGGGGVNLAVPWLKSSGVSTTEGMCTLTFAWGAAPSAELYEADYKVNDTAWAQAALSGQLSYALQATPSQMIQFRVRAKAAGGIGAYQSLSITACGAATAVAPDPGQLALESPFIGPVLKVAWSLTAGVSVYKLRIYDTATMTLRREVETTASRYDYSYLDAIADGGTHRNMTLRLHTTRNGVVSDAYSQLAVSNPQVAALTGLQVVGFNAQVGVLYTAPTVSDWAGILIYMSETANFTPSAANLVYDGIEPVIGLRTATAAPYYVRVAAYDYWGRDNLNLSDQYSGSAILVDTAPIQEELDQLAEDLAEANQTLTAAQNQLAQQQAQLAIDLAALDTELSNADVVLAQSLTSTNQTLATANTNIAGLNSQLVTVNQSLAANATAISNVNTALTATNATLAIVDNVLAGVQTDLSAANTAIADNATVISNTNTTLAATNATLAAANNTLANVQTGLASANTAIAANASAISEANTVLTATNATLTVTNNTLAGVQTGLSSANSAITANATAISEAEATLAVTNNTLTSVQTGLVAANSAITANATAISNTNTTLTATNNTLTATNNTLAGVQTGLASANSAITANADAIAAANLELDTVPAQITNTIAAGVSATYITGQITATQITDGAISTPKLAAGSVIAGKLAAGAVEAASIAAGAVIAGKIAANAVTATNIAALSVNAGHLVSDAITSDKIAANAITASEIASLAVTTGKIAANAVTANEIAANSVTASKIAALSVNAGHIVADAITSDKIAANAITAEELAANSVTAGKIAANSVTAANIAALSINSGHIVSDAITADKIAANAVTASELAALSVVAGKIAANAVTADEIAANAVTAGKIAALSINAGHIVSEAITADKIAANAITASELAALSVVAGKIATNAVTADTIAANAVTAGKIAALSINAGHIVSDAITSDKIVANAITADELAANSVIAGKIATNAVTANEIAANAVTAGKIAALSINASHIVADSITGDKIAANSIGTAELIALAITSDKLAVNAVTADKIDALAITSQKIVAGAITTQKLAVGAVTANEIGAGAIVAGKIAANAVTTGTLVANAVTADKIVANAVSADKIAANAVTAGKIAALTITGDKIAANTMTADKLFVSDLSAITANMGTITAGKIQSPSGLISVDMAAQYSNPVIRINKGGTYDAAFWVTADGQVRLSGALEVRSPESNSQMRSVATHGYSSAMISNGRYPDTGNGVQFHAPNTHSSAAIRQRVRSYYTTYQTLPIVVTATAVVDHYFSLWYWIEGTSTDWTYLTGTYDPVGGDGSVTLTQVIELVPSSGRILITASSSDSNRNCYDNGKQWMKNYSISAMVVNI
jgi:predicted  nucleic acid-binding Zn-ribbon protein